MSRPADCHSLFNMSPTVLELTRSGTLCMNDTVTHLAGRFLPDSLLKLHVLTTTQYMRCLLEARAILAVSTDHSCVSFRLYSRTLQTAHGTASTPSTRSRICGAMWTSRLRTCSFIMLSQLPDMTHSLEPKLSDRYPPYTDEKYHAMTATLRTKIPDA